MTTADANPNDRVVARPPMLALVELWDRRESTPPARRVLHLLSLARPEGVSTRPGVLTSGQRDSLLLSLRAEMFGPTLELVSACAACQESMEFAVPVAQLQVLAPSWIPDSTTHTVEVDGASLRFRLPTGDDMVRAAQEPDALEARLALLSACVLDHSELDAQQVAAVAAAILDADPQSDLRFALACPSCGASASAALDPGDYLWRELDALVQRTLRDVWQLARATGWSEADILGMSPSRRALYLKQLEP